MNRRGFLLSAGAAAVKPAIAGADQSAKLHDVRLVQASSPDAALLSRAYALSHVVTPAQRALCMSETGVASVVRWARQSGRRFAVRSGGHCFEGFSQHRDLVIDLRGLDAIHYDAATGIVTVGAGVHLGTLMRTLAQHGRAVPAGICPSVAMSGYTLGGGVGYFGRRDGLLIDQLRSLRLITADGDLVAASPTENPDLFWACRGGGGDFGIVTELSYQTQPLQDLHWIRLVEPADAVRTAEVFFLWQHRIQQYPRHTTLHLRITRRTDATFLLVLEGLSGWQTDDLEREVASLLRTDAERVRQAIFTGEADQIVRRMLPDGGAISANLLNHSHLFDGPVGERGTLDILARLMEQPHGRVHLNIEPLGGAVADVAADATAFPHRQTSFAIQSQVLLRDGDDKKVLLASNEAMRWVLQPLANGGVYLNYPDLTLSDWGRRYWGSNLPRLKSIKARYDPDNVFTHAQSLERA